MEPLSAVGSIISILQVSAAVVKYVRGVRGAPSERDRLCREIHASDDCLIQIRSLVQGRGVKDEWLEAIDRMCCSEDCPLQVYRIALEHLESKLQPASGIKKVGQLLTWPFSKQDVQDALVAIERQKLFFVLALQMDHGKLIHAMHASIIEASEILKTVETNTMAIGRDLKEVVEKNREENDAKILEWLSSFPYQGKHRDVRSRRLPGTGQWLLDSEEYRTWRDGPLDSNNSLLWCAGIPGAGKTMVASIIIDDLITNFGEEEITDIAYFYCDYKQGSSQNAQTMIASILKQFAIQNIPLPQSLVDLYNKKRKFTDKLTLQDFKAITPLLINEEYHKAPVYVVVDAFDEVDKPKERKEFLKFLTSIRSCAKILMTSRKNLADLESFMTNAAKITIEANPADIKLYLAEQIEDNSDFQEVAGEKFDALKDQIIDKIVESSRGMFLLPALQIQSVLNKDSIAGVRRALENLPNELGTLFKETLERMRHSTRSDLALRALMWVSLAKRPLEVEELRYALAIQPDQAEFDTDYLIASNIIKSSCLGLIVTDNETSTWRLVHFSLQEYLIENKDSVFPSGDLSVAKTCITCLSFGPFREGPRTLLKDYKKDETTHPLLYYAARYWGEHYKIAGDPLDDSEAFNFLQNSNLVDHASQIQYWSDWAPEVRRKLFSFSPKGWTGLQLSAHFDLNNTTRKLIESGAKVSTKAEDGTTPLHSACETGAFETAKLLLENGADSNSVRLDETPGDIDNCEDKKNWCSIGLTTPLHSATEAGHESIARLLLDNGANIHALTTDGDTPLIAAINGKSNISLIRLLIERGQDISARAFFQFLEWSSGEIVRNRIGGFTALHLAASWGDNSTTELLIEKGADINSLNDQGQTPLIRSVIQGQSTTAMTLLNHGADVSVVDEFQKNALIHAAGSNMDRVVEKMLQMGAEINSESLTPGHIASLCNSESTRKLLTKSNASLGKLDDDGLNALHWTCASEAPEEPIHKVQYLLENNVDPDARANTGESPLWYAVSQPWPNVISLLLSKGATTDAGGPEGMVLRQAIIAGNENIVSKILEYESNFDSRLYYELNETPLTTAMDRGHLGIVKAILQADESALSVLDRLGRHPLSMALFSGKLETVEYLLSRYHVSLDEPQRGGITFLMSAAYYGQLEAAKFLITRGADVHLSDYEDRGVLHGAAMSGKVDVISYLLEKGLDVNMRDKYQTTPLINAVQSNHLEATGVLLANSADINSNNIAGTSPLSAACSAAGPDMISELIQKGADPLHVAWGLNTITHLAARATGAGNLETVLTKTGPSKNGPGVSTKNRLGYTPLHECVLSKSEVVEKIFLLCDANCDIDDLGSHKESALHIASKQELETAVWALLERKCSTTLKNESGHTAIDLIREKKKEAALHEDATEENPFSQAYIKQGHFAEKPIAKLKRIVRSLVSDQQTFKLSSRPRPTNLPLDPTTKLRVLVEKLKPTEPSENDFFSNKKSKTKTLKKDTTSAPEHRLKKLRRIERLLKSYSTDDNTKTISSGSSLVNQIEQAFEGSQVNLAAAIESGVDINSQDDDGITPIYAAASAGRYTIVDQCLRLGANLNLPNCNLDTALHVAVREGEIRIVARLLRSGKANIDTKNKQGNTPLHMAVFARKDSFDVIRLLLRKGAKINEQNGEGNTALILAVKQGLEDEVGELLDSQADATIQNSFGNTALHEAIEGGRNFSIKKLLALKNQDVTKVNEDGKTVTHLASDKGPHRIFLELVKKGGNVRDLSKRGSNCLHLAAYGNQLETLKFLMQEKGLDIYLPARMTGWSALHIACYLGKDKIVPFLLAQGVQIDLKGAPPQGPYDNDKEAIYVRDSEGMTPLIAAAMGYGDAGTQTNICSLLLRRGADIEARTVAGITALMRAAELNVGSHRVETLLRAGADANARNNKGASALHYAVSNGGFRATHLLLAHGADIAIVDKEGKTPLQKARDESKKVEANEEFERMDRFNEVIWLLEKAEKGEKI